MSIEAKGLRLDPTELLAHAAWVRGLARTLVRDAASADDLVQDAWLAALRAPPPADRPTKAWLAGVLRRLAYRMHRSETRRTRREGVAAERRHPPADPVELVQRIESQRLLSRAVLDLDEPLRTTVLLRYVHDLSAAEIARRTDTPAGTVRWRLKHGLNLLRERLDAQHGGDRRAWCLAILALAAEDGPGAGKATGTLAALTGGALTMGLGTKVGVAAAVLLAAVLGWSLVPSDGGREDGVPAASGETDATPRARPERRRDRGGNADGAEPSEHAAESAAAGPAVPASRARTPSSTTLATVRVRFVDAAGRPVAGVVVRPMFGLKETALSGADGRAEISLEVEAPQVSWRFLCEAPVHAHRMLEVALERGRETDVGDLVLGPAGAVSGQVVDAAGRAVPDAWVGVAATGQAPIDLEEERLRTFEHLVDGASTTAADDGTFVLPGVPVGRVRLWAGKEQYLAGFSSLLAVTTGGEVARVRVVLETIPSGRMLAGAVLAPDGTPVAGATLEYRYRVPGPDTQEGSGTWFTDGSGVFQLTAVEGAHYTLVASDPNRRWPAACALDVVPGATRIVLRFETARPVKLIVTGAAGAPVVEYAVRVTDLSGQSTLARLGPAVRKDGRAVLGVPAHPFVVEVDAPGFALARTVGIDPEALEGPIEIALDPLPGVHGNVRLAGVPVAGATVALHAVVPDDERVLHNGFFTAGEPNPTTETSTDATGAYALTLRESGRFVLRVTQPGSAPTEIGPMDIDHRNGRADLDAELGPGGVIEGRVLVDGDRSAAGIVIGANRGDGQAQTVRTDVTGAFRFEGVTPGPWEVRESATAIVPGSSTTQRTDAPRGELDATCTVRAGQVTRVILDLRAGAHPEVPFVGAFGIGGTAARGWSAVLEPTGRDVLAAPAESAVLDTDGRFRIGVAKSGAYRLTLRPPGGSSWTGLTVQARVDVRAGAADWALDVRTGTVLGRTTGDVPAGGAGSLILACRDGNVLYVRIPRPDAQGVFEFALPVGSWKVIRQPGPDGVIEEPAAFDVAPGRTVEVDVRQ